MTQKSKSRNASCVPFRGRGPRSGEGVDGGKNDYDILIPCLIALKGKRLTTFCASLRSGGRRLAVRTAMEHPIGTLPRTPFPASRDFPSRGNERYEGKNSESYTSGTISAFSPFGGWCHHLSPASGGTITRAYCRAAYEERLRGVLFCPRLRGKSGVAGKGEASAASQSAELFFMPYGTESKSVTLIL